MNGNNKNKDIFNNIDVSIIGGGLSGLVSSYKIKIKAPTLNVVIFEASNKIGGQLEQTKLGEIGGKWITKDHYHIFNLCKNLGVKLCIRKSFEVLNNNLQRCWDIDYGIFSYLVNLEVERFIYGIDIKSHEFGKKCNGKEYKIKDETLENHIRSKLFFKKSRTFVRLIVKMLWGMDCEKLSFTDFLCNCYEHGGLSNLISLLTGTSNEIFEFSSQELLENLLDHIGSVRIIKNTKIIGIMQQKNEIVIYDDHNNQFQSSVIILAVPWNDLNEIKFEQNIPQIEFDIIEETSTFITSFLIKYDQSYWKENKFSGSLMCFDPQIIGYEIEPGIYGGMILHNNQNHQNANLKMKILNTLSIYFRHQMMLYPSEWIERTFEHCQNLHLPRISPIQNRIIWSSTSNATSFRGFLSGAVQSGLRAAVDVLLFLRPQNVNWEDLAEIQEANAVHFIKTNWLNSLLSSVNLYNSIYFTVTGLILISSFLFRYQIYSLFDKNQK